MKRAFAMLALAGATVLAGHEALAQDHGQVNLSDGLKMTWGRTTLNPGFDKSKGTRIVQYGTPYQKPPFVVVTPGTGSATPTFPLSAVTVWKVTEKEFLVSGDRPGIEVNYIAIGR